MRTLPPGLTTHQEVKIKEVTRTTPSFKKHSILPQSEQSTKGVLRPTPRVVLGVLFLPAKQPHKRRQNCHSKPLSNLLILSRSVTPICQGMTRGNHSATFCSELLRWHPKLARSPFQTEDNHFPPPHPPKLPPRPCTARFSSRRTAFALALLFTAALFHILLHTLSRSHSPTPTPAVSA